jgi:hypothetical protein
MGNQACRGFNREKTLMSSISEDGRQVRVKFQRSGPSIRRAGPADAHRVAELFQSEYGNSSHPFRTVEGVRAFLSDSRNCQMIAEDRGRVVSSMAMTYYEWNSSSETGRGVTLPDYRCGGLAAILLCRVVDWAHGDGQGEVFFGYPRVRRIADLCSDLQPPILMVGHDAGLNVANGSRETHLIVISAPIRAGIEHVAPLAESLAGYSFIQRSTYDKLSLRGKPGRYPRRVFVGNIVGSVMRSDDFLVQYDPIGPNQAVEILSSEPGVANPDQLCSQLRKCLACFPAARHVTATVLADKGSVIQGLEEIGFRITAYLPAWHKAGRARFDCIQMARVSYAEVPNTHDLGDLIADFDRAVCHPRAAADAGRRGY